MGLVGVNNSGVVAAAAGGKSLHQGGHHRVGGVGEGCPPGTGRKRLQFPRDGHRPLGGKDGIAKGDGVQQRPGPVLTVRGQHRAGQLAQLCKNGGGLFQGGQSLQGAGKAEVIRRQGRPGDGSGPEPFPQFI